MKTPPELLSSNETAALYVLADSKEPCTATEIHESIEQKSSFKYTLGSTHKSMDRMYNRDLVSFEEREKKYPDKSTRKVRYYSITEAGHKALLSSRQLHEEMAPPLINLAGIRPPLPTPAIAGIKPAVPAPAGGTRKR